MVRMVLGVTTLMLLVSRGADPLPANVSPTRFAAPEMFIFHGGPLGKRCCVGTAFPRCCGSTRRQGSTQE